MEDIAKKFNITIHTLKKYIKKGEKLGWCKYIKRYNSISYKRKFKKVKVIEDNKIFNNVNECINYSKNNGFDGVCMLGFKKQKNWLSDQNFVKHSGFVKCDETLSGYELLCLSFNGTYPEITDMARKEVLDYNGLRIYYSYQCPFIHKRIEKLKQYCSLNNIECEFILIDTVDKAKKLPGPFNNFAVFYNGRLVETNQIDEKMISRILTQ